MSLATLVLLDSPALAGIAAGYALGGRLTHLTAVPPRALWLLWVAVGVQAAQYFLPAVRRSVEQDAGIPMLAVTFGTGILWLTLNVRWSRPALSAAILVIALGAGLNAAVVLLNGRMPYSVEAARIAGLPPGTVTPKNQPADGNTRLAALGDVIPLRPIRRVLSPGDILIMLGGAAVIAVAMRRPGSAARPARATDRSSSGASRDHLPVC
ncbi:DUF5317 family protein [Catellatospora aurea]|uniref:DUF5317 family protein n=1 Tax=Catellatospora aurea TaxID=1337874 RepID=A0ABW2GWJ2_9ACTN